MIPFQTGRTWDGGGTSLTPGLEFMDALSAADHDVVRNSVSRDVAGFPDPLPAPHPALGGHPALAEMQAQVISMNGIQLVFQMSWRAAVIMVPQCNRFSFGRAHTTRGIPGQLVPRKQQALQFGQVPQFRRNCPTELVAAQGAACAGWSGSPTPWESHRSAGCPKGPKTLRLVRLNNSLGMPPVPSRPLINRIDR